MKDIVELVRVANEGRKAKNLQRRIMKCGEEYGEACQAYLAVTSKNNKKQKTWDDVREELTDVIIVALDCLLTQMPDEGRNVTPEGIRDRIEKEFERKLAKWTDKVSTQDEKDDSE